MRGIRTLIGILVSAMTAVAPAQTEPTRIDSFDKTGRLTCEPVPGAAVYLVERASGVTGEWVTVQAVRAPGREAAVPVDGADRAFYRASAGIPGGRPAPAGLALIPAGSFAMGDAFGEGLSRERPVRTVRLAPFYIGRHEITKGDWDVVRAWGLTRGYTDLPEGGGKASDHPVHSVSWYDAVKWCNAVSEMEDLTPCYYTHSSHRTVYRTGVVDVGNTSVKWGADGYRLPTEAEWEKAGRGGAAGHRFPWSDDDTISHARANYRAAGGEAYDLSHPAGYHPAYHVEPAPYTSPVNSFPANDYGVQDMAGNVWEWCWDRFDAAYYAAAPADDPRGPVSGEYRVRRGGTSGGIANFCRVAVRDYGTPGVAVNVVGFRFARSVTEPEGMVLIPAGAFVMGNAMDPAEGHSDELPLHTVHVSAFYMDRFEVTKAKWDEVYDWAIADGYDFDSPGYGKADDHPVCVVNWYDMVKWCNARSRMEGLGPVYRYLTGSPPFVVWNEYRTGQRDNVVMFASANGYRLPTEAEWEKAARGGAAGHRFPWTDSDEIQHARACYVSRETPGYDTSPTLGHHPLADMNSPPYTIPVGTLAPNAYGLYDMAGNMRETCWDRYLSSYYSSSPASDPQGPPSGTSCVQRGGSANDFAVQSRVAERIRHERNSHGLAIGFRCVRGF